MPVIGWLSGGSPKGYARNVTAFLEGLKESDFVEGQNVTIEYRWAEGQYDRLPEMVADLIRRQVAVIIGSSTCGIGRKGGDHKNSDCLHH